VHHARAAEQAAVGVDHGRGVEAALAIPLVEVEDDDHAKIRGPRGKGIRHRPRHLLGEALRVLFGRALRVEGLEGELRVTHEVGAARHRLFEGLETPLEVVLPIVGRVLLNEGDAHGAS
jgi:hypothetical protein